VENSKYTIPENGQQTYVTQSRFHVKL